MQVPPSAVTIHVGQKAPIFVLVVVAKTATPWAEYCRQIEIDPLDDLFPMNRDVYQHVDSDATVPPLLTESSFR